MKSLKVNTAPTILPNPAKVNKPINWKWVVTRGSSDFQLGCQSWGTVVHR